MNSSLFVSYFFHFFFRYINLVYIPISVLQFASINFFSCIIKVLKQPKGSKTMLHLELNLVVGKVVPERLTTII